MRASASRDLGLPSIYLHLLAELLRSTGVDEQSLLMRVGLDPSRLRSTELRVSQPQASEFMTRAIIESGEPGLGILLAGELKLPLHGALGTAVMSSRTLGEALDLMTRYLTLRSPNLRVERHQEGGQAVFRVICSSDLGPLQGFALDATVFCCVALGTQLTGAPIEGAYVRRRGPEPAYFQRFKHRIPLPVQYQAAEDAIVIPCQHLSSPLRFSDEQLAAASRAQCEEALHTLTRDAGFSTRVRRVIETSHPFPPKLARVASTLFVSERTLKRRLHEENSSFQTLVDDVRLERAGELLEGTAMNLSQIADALGYADAANFTRAFKRWTGVSPSQFRAEHCQGKSDFPTAPANWGAVAGQRA
ncbi:MAG: AraC family transcriptional regulator [Marinobacter sp.]|uniref:AraC family transcriptional regulator n=1 Tax=Marinobacter sp. TaxID=50741 RepID=UPI00299DD238|nr:AraC family transcriptional regulator [Marinobacter sp.]MDX1634323.1 AraC family transcriptional regulator [Marinobacter sp.]